MDNSILDVVQKSIEQQNLLTDAADRAKVLANITRLKNESLNVMFVGATGVGKSTTINALFRTDVAKVGNSPNPETSFIRKYELENMVLWDTPGLGDNPEKDRKYAAQIVHALKERDSEGNLVIDEVVVIIDGSNRDMLTTYELIENVILPYIGDPERIIIAINQCDVALKGRYWNYDTNEPEVELLTFLEKKVESIQRRIQESSGIKTFPFYYSALHHYNISKLLLAMIRGIPETKRFLFTASLNRDPEVWKANDKIENYSTAIKSEVQISLTKALDHAAKGALAGATVGSLVPVIGTAVGAAAGAVLGFLGGLFGL